MKNFRNGTVAAAKENPTSNKSLTDGDHKMNFTITRRGALVGAGSLAAVTALPTGILADAHSAHEILMLNKDPDNPKNKMLFAPSILKVNAGDTVKFLHFR